MEKDGPTERAAYLDEACGTGAPFRQWVEALLRSLTGLEQIKEMPAAAFWTAHEK